MPCRDYDEPVNPEIELRKRLDDLTALFCATMHDLEEQGLLKKTRGDAQDWLARHKKLDEIRIADEKLKAEVERLRKIALSKLSNEEKWALRMRGVTYKD
jgi:hypothetical protein